MKRAEKAVEETRSRIMRAVRSKDTEPERRVRSLIWRLGYRFTLHQPGLPGRPDIVLPGRRKVIFVHGCFWHGHSRCSKALPPKSRKEYWIPKLKQNKQRDIRSVAALRALGWKTLVVWQCQLGKSSELAEVLERFLGPPGSAA